MNATALLRTHRLAAGYHGHPIARDVNIEVRPGEIVALLGPNGAGKTTLLRTIAGFLTHLDGEIELFGRPTRAAPHIRARRGLAFVTEERSVFPLLSVADNLRVSTGDPEVALTLFPELRPLLRRKSGSLSGGEQQMLTLGRALARRPALLLADELSLGLGPLIVERLLDAVRKVVDEDQVGAMIVEQHVHHVLRYANRVYVLRRGSIVLSGTVTEVAPHLERAYLSSTEL